MMTDRDDTRGEPSAPTSEELLLKTAIDAGLIPTDRLTEAYRRLNELEHDRLPDDPNAKVRIHDRR